MHHRLAAAAGFALFLAACAPEGDPPSSAGGDPCTPGGEAACACPGGGEGTAACAADGTPGECLCGEGGGGAASSGSAGGGGAGGGGAGGAGVGGASGGGGDGGAGGALVCAPGATIPCYSGPPGSEGVGACKAGARTCAADGSGYGECVGETLPAVEECDDFSPDADEDCDGLVNEDGPGCACAPGDQVPCYWLPGGTEGVGACAAGVRTCEASGTGYGSCVGAVYPHAEDCSTPEDEDCDGTPGPCADVGWSRRFGDAGMQHVVKVAPDPAGGVILSVVYYGTIDFGGGPLPSAGGADMAVARLDANGDHLWSKRFGGAGGESFTDVATDPQGNVILAGSAKDPIDLGGGVLPAGGGNDILLLKLDSNGDHVWSKRFSTGGSEHLWAVAAGASGDIFLFGNGTDLAALDLGAGPLPGDGAMFLARLDADGNPIWNKRLWTSPDGMGFPSDMVLDAAGDIVLDGMFEDAVDLGGGPIGGVDGKYGPFLGKLDAAGNHLWSRSFKSVDANVGGLAAAPNGDVILTGIHEDGLDLGGGILGDGANDAPAMFVGRYDAAGNHLHSTSLGGGEDPTYAAGASAITDAAGNVTITGAARGYVDFGSGYILSEDYQLFLTTFDPAGNLLFSARYGITGPALGLSLARASDGQVLVAGTAEGTIDFGLGTLQSAGSKDIVVAKMAF